MVHQSGVTPTPKTSHTGSVDRHSTFLRIRHLKKILEAGRSAPSSGNPQRRTTSLSTKRDPNNTGVAGASAELFIGESSKLDTTLTANDFGRSAGQALAVAYDLTGRDSSRQTLRQIPASKTASAAGAEAVRNNVDGARQPGGAECRAKDVPP